MCGSATRRKGEKKERKGKKEKEGRKERRRGIENNVVQGVEPDDKRLGIVLREVSFLLLRLFYA